MSGHHTLTDYVSSLFTGHTDVVMGVAVTNDDKLAERLRFLQNGNFLLFYVFI